jgi:hypothetical protein
VESGPDLHPIDAKWRGSRVAKIACGTANGELK